MKDVTLFAAVMLFIISLSMLIAGPGECAEFPGLHLHKLTVDRVHGTGQMDATWSGEYPVTFYEGRWLPYNFENGRAAVSFEAWVKTWVGTCEPPCRVQIEFITQNVKVITK